MNPALYEELTFSWKRKIANAIFEHKIQKEMILNFNQTAVGFTTPNKSTFTGKRVHSVPIANVDDKRQITATFCVNIVGDFLPVHLIYGGVTDKCYPKVKLQESFHITHIIKIIGLTKILLWSTQRGSFTPTLSVNTRL